MPDTTLKDSSKSSLPFSDDSVDFFGNRLNNVYVGCLAIRVSYWNLLAVGSLTDGGPCYAFQCSSLVLHF